MDEKEKFMEALQKQDFRVEDQSGVVVAIVPRDSYEESWQAVRETAEKTGYRRSMGVAMEQKKPGGTV